MVKYALRPIKILGEGDIDKKINIVASAFSSSAIKKIEKAKLELRDDIRTLELKNWLNHIRKGI